MRLEGVGKVCGRKEIDTVTHTTPVKHLDNAVRLKLNVG